MKNVTFLLLLISFFLTSNLKAQLPDIPNVDYSSQTGTFEDTRDGKTYAYKKYGKYDWFMQNLNWDGAGIAGENDPDGTIYGRYYNVSESNQSLCPKGWTLAQKGDWVTLFNTINEEYEATGLEPKNQNNWTIFKAGLYLRAGGTTADGGIWSIGDIDPKANQIQFNILPSGIFNGETSEQIGETAYFLIGGKELYYTATGSESSNDNYHENMRHDQTNVKYGNVRCVRYQGFADVKIPDEYYPTEIELNQINGADKETDRLCQGHKKYDRQPTGFYVETGKKVIVNVDILTAATDFASPKLTIGTLGMLNNDERHEVSLKKGINEIVAPNAGLIYLSFITSRAADPVGKAKITFTEDSEHVRAPRYIYGKTTDEEFESMLGKYETQDVIFHSDYVIACATRSNAISLSMKEDKKKWMDAIHLLMDLEDEISGLDNNDPNPIHHRLKAGEIRQLFTENKSASPHASSAGYTGYPAGSVHRYLTYAGIYDASWMMGHEVGHQHQQPAYQISQSTESTVNIYSYYVERTIQEQKGNFNYNRTSAERWEQAHNTYLSLPIEERIYNMPDSDLEEIIGFNRDELRFMPWEHMFLIFGDEFYKRLHRITREENVTGGTEQERRVYLIWKTSQISGYDMREFFNEWGIRVTDENELNAMNEKFEEALANESVIPLPYSIEEILNVTGQNRPEWAPLPLRGATKIEEVNWETKSNILNIYPNPVRIGEKIILDISNIPESLLKKSTIKIYNISGQKIGEESFNNNYYKLTISQPGVYIISLENDSYKRQGRIIVK